MCYSPIQIQHDTNIHTLPCGKCEKCYKKRISSWSFRLMQEDRFSLSSHFITLTYDIKTVPITKRGYMTLDKRDVQLFMKRLRKENANKLKYYLCGEYGGQTKRPHYHMIIFNVDIKTIQKAWNKGHVHYGQVSKASVGYTLKYMFKSSKIPEHKNDDRQKEFSLMSKRLGQSYMTTKMIKWHKMDLLNRFYCNIEDGKKIAMPRYYKEKIYTRDELLEIKGYFSEKHRLEIEDMTQSPDWELYVQQMSNYRKHQQKKIKYDEQKRGN